jgi:hypothetical protein
MSKLGGFRQVSRELRRIGVPRFDGISGVSMRRHRRKGRVTFEEDELSWNGTVEETLDLLQAIPDNAQAEGFWRAVCPQAADAHYREVHEWYEDQHRLEQELRRVDVTWLPQGGGVDVLVGHPADAQGPRPCRVNEAIVVAINPDTPETAVKPVERWSGTVDEASSLLAQLPDGAGLLAFWRVFAPDLADEPRVMLDEARRVEGRALAGELERLRASDIKRGRRVDFRSRIGTLGEPLTWIAYDEVWGPAGLKTSKARWKGTADEALDGLKTLSDSAGVDEVWRVLSG